MVKRICSLFLPGPRLGHQGPLKLMCHHPMVYRSKLRVYPMAALFLLLIGTAAYAQQAGSIRGMVYDKDFDVPLAAAEITIAETGEKVISSDDGNYVFGQLQPGQYTLIFAKSGYVRQVKANVVVSPGQMTEIDISLSGEFTDMEEFIVQDLALGGTEADLLNIRMDSDAIMDSVGADMMSQAGAGDAASALKLVAGATVQDGKYAVIRGLPDRYVSSQMNGVRLPTADADKRAVQLDQFPSAVIESIQVTKTFTPDQQGDASGGAVNLVLKNIPQEPVLKFKVGIGVNSQVVGRNDFLTYDGGGVDFLGMDNGGRDIPADGNFGGASGVKREDAPWFNYDMSLTAGTREVLENEWIVGGLATLFYKRDNGFYDNGINDSYWVEDPGDPMTPQFSQGSPSQGDWITSLLNVTQGSQEVKWGGLATIGIENDEHALGLLYMYTHVAEDKATLAEDTRGKPYYFNATPYDPSDPDHPGNWDGNQDAAPYLRYETLEYTERSTSTVQFNGSHLLPDPQLVLDGFLEILQPEIDWTVAFSSSTLDQPDKRLFASKWWAAYTVPGIPWLGIPDQDVPAKFRQHKPAANFNMGNYQRVWKEISEDSSQYFINLTLPFTQWDGEEGYFKFGLFDDAVKRDYKQESFSNFGENNAELIADWSVFWSETWEDEGHPMIAGEVDVDYKGDQDISAWYYMIDLPVVSSLHLVGGARYESTKLSIVNIPEADVQWIPLQTGQLTNLAPGAADVDFQQDDVLPSLGLIWTLSDDITVRASYAETVARQTFKELTPIMQMEYLGGDVFIGNPDLMMSALKNYDLRFDYQPNLDSLISVSWFYKDIKDPIEYVQRVADFVYTTPINYPEGTINGFEFEFRQDLGAFSESLYGLAFGANFTLIDSEVTLPEDEADQFNQPNIMVPMTKRDMTNAPEHLYNIYLTYDLEDHGTRFGLFYTVKGDTLIAGAGQSSGNFVPSVYAREYGTLNFSVSQSLGEQWNLSFQAKNLTNPEIREVYRSDAIGGDVLKTSHTKGIEFKLSIGAKF